MLRQVGIGPVAGQLVNLVEEFLARIGAEIALCDFLVRDIGDFLQVLDRVERKTHHAAGEAAVAAGLFLGRGLQHHNAGALFPGGQGGAQRGIAFADYDDVVFMHLRLFLHWMNWLQKM